ncbi:MAG TPA: hypothetical protein VFL90_10665 [Methylomirabilota bacterium]|nr:hypothetical protein [Methylomirabilota bacterium]
MRAVTTAIVGVALAAALAACATPQGAYLNKDEPENRLLSSQMGWTGRVARVDQPQQVIVLDNGQMYRIGDNPVYVNGQPVALNAVQPGSTVVITSATPVYYQNGQYVAVSPVPAPGPVVAAPSAVTTAPGTTVTTAPAVTTPARIYGRVTDVDRHEIRVRTDDGRSFEMRVPAGTVIHKGDPVMIELGAASPAALPR